MNLGKTSAVMLTVVAIGLIIAVLWYFPIAKLLMKLLGLYSADSSTQSYTSIADAIKRVGAGTEGTIERFPITMDEDTAIIGFANGANEVMINKRGAMGVLIDIKDMLTSGDGIVFKKPVMCGEEACVCVCRKIEYDPVLGYACRENKPGDTTTYLECTNDLGTDIIDYLPADKYIGRSEFMSYDLKGGFVVGKFTTSAVIVSGKAGGVMQSPTFNIPSKTIVSIEKGRTKFIAVCFDQSGCLDQATNDEQVNKELAYSIYVRADRYYINEKDYDKAAAEYDRILNDPVLSEALMKKQPHLIYVARFNRAMIEYKKQNYQRAVELLDIGFFEQFKLRTDIIPSTEDKQFLEMFEKEKFRIDCDFVKKDCSCYDSAISSYSDICERSNLGCYLTLQKSNYLTWICRNCKDIEDCSGYGEGVLEGFQGDNSGPFRSALQEICRSNSCKLPACMWSSEDRKCTELAG